MEHTQMKKNKFLGIFILLLMILFLSLSTFATIEDNFDRANNASLGIATNGNTWTEAGSFELNNNELWNNNPVGTQLATLELVSKNSSQIDFQWKMETNSNINYITICETSACPTTEQAFIFYMIAGELKYYSGGAWNSFDTPFTPSNNVYYNYSVRNINYTADTFDLYVDNVLKETAGPFRNNKGTQFFVAASGTTDIWMDCIITGGDACIAAPSANTTVNILNITANDVLFVNETYFNVSEIIFNVTYEVNDTYAGYWINSTLINQSGLTDGNYTIQFNVTYNQTSDISDLFTYHVDTVAPIVSANSFSTWNQGYTLTSLNSTLNVSCTDNNLVNCTIDWDDGTSTNLLTTQSKTFTTNGNHTFNLTGLDLAGNSASSLNNIVLDDPLQYIYFNDTEADALITNFTINGTLYGSVFNFTVYEFGLGNHTFQFAKAGLQTSNFVVELTNTSAINTTIQIVKSRIIINLYDANTSQLITNETFDMQFQGVLGYIFQTNSSPFNISDSIAASDYTALISSTNYESKEVYFTYTAAELKEMDVYFIPIALPELGFVTIQAFKSDNTPHKHTSAYAKEWFPAQSAFVKVQETRTGNDGEAELKIILEDRIYLFCIYTEEFGETCTGDEIIKTTENGQVIPIAEETRVVTQTSFSEALFFSENITVLTSNVTGFRNLSVDFNWVDLAGFSLEMCYTIHKDYQYTQELVETDCITGSAGTFEQYYLLNSSYAYIVSVTANIDGPVLPMYYNVFQSAEPSESIEGVLEEKGMQSLALVLYIVVMMTIIALLKNPFHSVVVVFVAILGVNVFFSNLMSPYALSSLMTFCGMTAWGLRQLR